MLLLTFAYPIMDNGYKVYANISIFFILSKRRACFLKNMFTPQMLDMLVSTFADGNQRKFAEMLELNNPQTITDWKRRGVNRVDHIERIYKVFGDKLSAEWLITGEGDMFKQNISDNTSSTVVGNNVKGKEINIHNDCGSDALIMLKNQLHDKESEIVRLHEIINKLLK